MLKALFASMLLRKPLISPKVETPTHLPDYPICDKHYFLFDIGPFGVQYDDYRGYCQYCNINVKEYPTLNPFVTIH